MSLGNGFPLTDEQLAFYDDNGFVVIKGAVPKEALAPVADAFNGAVDKFAAAWKQEGLLSDTGDDLPFETRWAVLRAQVPPKSPVSWRKILVSRGIYGLWQQPEILGRTRSIVGDEVYAHGIWNGRPREPGTGSVQKVKWHQDAHYYKAWDPSDGKLVSCWMPLVPVDERSGCLQFLPGSHKRGLVRRIQEPNYLFTVPEEALVGITPVSVPAEPGDMILFSDLTLHQSLDNNSDYVRWSIDIRFGEATEKIISKTPTGYYCFSAADPSRVESYDTWANRYQYGRAELFEELETRKGPDGLARSAGASHAEQDLY